MLAGLLVVTGCGDLRDITTVAEAIQAQYHVPASIRIGSGGHLAITFQVAPTGTHGPDSATTAEFAHGVAAFAKAHYPKAAQLEDVTVQFATVSRSGPLTVTRTAAPYVFPAGELP